MTARRTGRLRVLALGLLVTLPLTACGSEDSQPDIPLSGTVVIDGSSTVEPLSVAAGRLFTAEHPGVRVDVTVSGTGGGFKKFCAKEIDIADASRPMSDAEYRTCGEHGVVFNVLQVANDALTVVVDADNTWAKCLTVEQLRKIWEPGSTVANWNEIDPAFPDEPLSLFGPDTNSGTFDYFTRAITGTEGATRTDYRASEDDNVTVAGVAAAKGALGYFGYSYYESNTDKLRAVAIDDGKGCITPSVPTAQDGSYKPLARPLFIYLTDTALRKPQVEKFAEFYITNNTKIVDTAGFIPMTSPQISRARAELADIIEIAGK
ncbi:PstS family phosphate ABC transporter substrate-binding protein [Nocardia arizonensis]|uniref:PstS family phosphate ABC transporter substrate-binding protein n=1 Tax=Nocardia arizonensis TaxID=1141647 RepID=UPI0006D0F334|nr:PstS family phosphate ABC transporter substrate-binding protein [Nocardia arizonensis]